MALTGAGSDWHPDSGLKLSCGQKADEFSPWSPPAEPGPDLAAWAASVRPAAAGVAGGLEAEAGADLDARGEAAGVADAAAAARVAGLPADGAVWAALDAVGVEPALGAAVGVTLGGGVVCGWGLAAATGRAKSSEQSATARSTQASDGRSRTRVLTKETLPRLLRLWQRTQG
jgi:hypothetical protein